jgi:hypothetical protein
MEYSVLESRIIVLYSDSGGWVQMLVLLRERTLIRGRASIKKNRYGTYVLFETDTSKEIL